VGFRLFLISGLILFLELACIRWFPAHVLFLTFFTNTVLLACFLGMSLGCLAAGRPRNYIRWTPFVLGGALLAAHAIEYWPNLGHHIDVGQQASPQMIFFGTESSVVDPGSFVIPIEFICGFFFVLIALSMVGPGQELGRLLNQVPNRLQAYTLNIAGSLAGIVAFTLMSWRQLSPVWWFLVITLAMGYILTSRRFLQWVAIGAVSVGVVWLAGLKSGHYVSPGQQPSEHLWSPYYRVDYLHDGPWPRTISVNLVGHQQMVSCQQAAPAYPLPHVLNRDSGGKPFEDVLIIGAGSGNDVSRALQWGAKHIDAVEIDPVIYKLGQKHHPDHPYQDDRVHVHINDGRNFLHSSPRQYDLIIYALVDSLVLQSSHSNIRLESYLFTQQAFADVRRHLKPGGLFAMYNVFRQGWLVARLHQGLAQVFEKPPLVIPLPYRDTIKLEDTLFHDFTLLLAGDTGRIEEQFCKHGHYLAPANQPLGPTLAQTPNGFEHAGYARDARNQLFLGPARMELPKQPLRAATDNWPFLYLRRPLIPDLNLRGMAIMGLMSLLLLGWFAGRRPVPVEMQRSPGRWLAAGRMFFLGAGFMLVETKAVVNMALLFGSTWIVNSLVFSAVLVMILLANVLVLAYRPRRVGWFYAGLLGAVALNLMPLDWLLGINRPIQIALSCLLVSLPIFFAGIVFAISFARTREPDHALGANIAGSILGGLAEYTSMVLGFQYLMLVGLGFYSLSWLLGERDRSAEEVQRLDGSEKELLSGKDGLRIDHAAGARPEAA
jgi:SAM-dependent methyltransferase